MKKNKIIFASLFFSIFFAMYVFNVCAAEYEYEIVSKADFRIDYLISEKTFCVNDSCLPEFVGNSFPYKIYATNLSEGDTSYEWFIKYPGKEYILESTASDPIFTINQYGKIYIKLQINNSDTLADEYFFTTLDYSIKKEKNIVSINKSDSPKECYSSNTTVIELTTVISNEPFKDEIPPILPPNSSAIDDTDFKISYSNANKFYNINDGPILVESLPYKVTLTKNGEDDNFVWYIKLPGQEYVWMDNTQNAVAEIWRYGTTNLKLVVDDNFNNAVQYSVTAYGKGESLELKDAIEKHKNIININSAKANFSLKCINTFDNITYDVTNTSLRDDHFVFPYKIIPINLSKGDLYYEWLIKTSDIDIYQPLSKIPIIIDKHGPIFIKLRLNGDDSLTCEKKIVSYFSDSP